MQVNATYVKGTVQALFEALCVEVACGSGLSNDQILNIHDIIKDVNKNESD